MTHIPKAAERKLRALLKRYGADPVLGEAGEILSKNPKARRTKRRQGLLTDVRFFRRHAGGIVGRAAEGALALARAERYAIEHGWKVEWEPDQDADDSWMSEAERKQPHEAWVALLQDRKGKTLAALGGIFDPTPDYGRVIEAELALEAMPTRSKHNPKRRRGRRHTVRTGRIVRRSRRRVRRNPVLGVISNPAGTAFHTLSSHVYSIAYKHKTDGKDYKHDFASGVNMTLLSDGSIHIWSRTKRLWEDIP